MQGLQLTYETLAETRNEAAVDVLLAALNDTDANNRRLALPSLLSRKEPQAPAKLFAIWGKLTPDDIVVLGKQKEWMSAAVEEALHGNDETVFTAIEAAEALGLTTALPQLILQAESSASREIKQRASEAVINLVRPLGEAARADRNQPTVRRPAQAKLADSVRRFSMHRNEQLVDAFLLVSTWGDSELRNLISQGGQDTKLICSRFDQTEEPEILSMLAGCVRRKSISPEIGEILQARTDEQFRNALLHQIGGEPNATVARNLHKIGIPKCCRGGEKLLDEVTTEYIAPLIHLYVVANQDHLETLHLITATVACGEPGVEAAAVTGFSRCEVPDIGFWMRAAVPIADGQQEAIQRNDNARLLKRLIDLLDHPNPSLARSVRHLLAPLHADQIMHKFQPLRQRSRRRLGKVVMMIDPDAVQRVHDTLDHAVLNYRLDAIAAADALDVVDQLVDSFAQIIRGDHQEARIKAVEAMSGASGDATLQLLQEMANLPECPVRDTALKAIKQRQSSPVG